MPKLVQISAQTSVGCSLNCNVEVVSQLVYMVFLQVIDHDPNFHIRMELGFHLKRQFSFINIGLHCNILNAISHYSSWLGLHTHTHTHTFFGFRKNARVFSGKVLLEEAMLCLFNCNVFSLSWVDSYCKHSYYFHVGTCIDAHHVFDKISHLCII